MTGRQFLAAYWGLNGVLLLCFALWATRRQWLFDRAARVVPAEFIGWRATERQGRVTRDVLLSACYRYWRDGRPQVVQARAWRSRSSFDPSGPPRWLWQPARVVRYLPDAPETVQVGPARGAWAALLLLWAAGIALLGAAIVWFRQG